MTNSISEIVHNDVLFIIGSNATEAHPIIGNKMKQAAQRGAKLIVVDPRRTELAEHAYLWLRLKSGTDNALVNGILHAIISNGWQDSAYVEERCEGFDDLWETVKDYPPERASEITGVPVDEHPRGRGTLRHDTEGRHLLHAGHHRAHHRHGQRHEPRQPGHGHGSHRRRVRRRQSHARPEQRAGLLRHGRPAQLAPRLPERQRRRGAGSLLGGLRRADPREHGPAHPGDAGHGRVRQAQGHVHHGRRPAAHRRRRQPRAQGLGATSSSSSPRTSS